VFVALIWLSPVCRQRLWDIQAMATAHARVAGAIADANPEDAERAVEHLVDYVEKFTLKVVGFEGGN
tara:strand:+ start:6683 stop:6883 length:201 start_codon:yes stop_codon:yes gene_type:complete